MTLGLICLAAILLFLAGVILGFLLTPVKREKAPERTVPKIPESSLEELSEDFRNFLSYDGSEQL